MKDVTRLKRVRKVIVMGLVLCSVVTSSFTSDAKNVEAKIDTLHNPVYNEESQSAEYSYVYFGSYPQSEVTGEALTQDIIGARYSVSQDAVVEDEKYYRLQEADGTYRYFLYEPIRWQVISVFNNQAFLKSDLILDCQKYSEKPQEYWQDTSLRYWLNSYDSEERGFLKQAFTTEEISYIGLQAFEKDSCWQGTSYVRDRVFILSGNQIHEWCEYPTDDICLLNMKNRASDYAFARGVEKQDDTYGKWWLRNPAGLEMGEYAGYVDETGVWNQEVEGYVTDGDDSGNKYAIKQDTEGIGVCPVISLNLTNTKVWCTKEEMEQGFAFDRDITGDGIETGQCGDHAYYRIEDGTLYITGYGNMYHYYNNDEVSPFRGRPHIKKVVIEEGIELIGDYTFYNSTEIKEIVFPKSIKVVGEKAFAGIDWVQVDMEGQFQNENYVTKSNGRAYRKDTLKNVLLGDVNYDNEITLEDTARVLRMALLLEDTMIYDQKVADIDEDTKVTLNDAKKALRVSLLLEKSKKRINLDDNVKGHDIYATSYEPGAIKGYDFISLEMMNIFFYSCVQEEEDVILDKKPVIYLYPEETTEIAVSLEYNGEFTFTWPDYRDGWKVIAQPDGTLIDTVDGSEHNYLFWEGTSNVQYTFDKGFCVKGENTATFLKEVLEKQGLTPEEYNDMITFWAPLMQDNEYNVISFVEDIYTDNAKLTFSMEPDSMKRVFMVYYGSDKPIDIEEQEVTGFEREGFTVVEWGGAEVNESCYVR